MKKRLFILICMLLISGAILYGGNHLGLNTSTSVDFTLYWHMPLKELKTGRYYVIAYNGPEYQGLLVKRIACPPDAALTRTGNQFLCDGELVATVSITHAPDGTAYPQYYPDDSRGYFVIGDSMNTYDSRYFGILPAYSFKREVTPIW